MMKNIIGMVLGLAVVPAASACGAAGEQNMSAAEKESFISENLDAGHRHS